MTARLGWKTWSLAGDIWNRVVFEFHIEESQQATMALVMCMQAKNATLGRRRKNGCGERQLWHVRPYHCR